LSNPEGDEGYDRVEYLRGESFSSVQFPQLVLSVNTVLAPPVVEDLIRDEQAQLQQVQRQRDEQQERAERAEKRAQMFAAKLLEMGLDPDRI